MQDTNIHLLPDVDIPSFKVHAARLLIKPAPEVELKSKGGVLLPDQIGEKRRATTLSRGEVVDIGPKVEAPFKVGQTVFFAWNMGEGMVRQGEDIYLIIPEYAITASSEQKIEPVSEVPSILTSSIIAQA